MQVDSLGKHLVRKVWQTLVFCLVLLSQFSPKSRTRIAVFYGGARSGNVGGGLVKIKRLREFFPQKCLSYNVAYTLSNSPYLTLPGLGLLRRKGVPVVLNQNGVFYPAWYGGDWRHQNKIMADLYHFADYVFWQSNFCRFAADHFLGVREGSGEVLFNAVDIDRFRPATSRRTGSFRFLLTGKIGSHLSYRLESTIRGLAYARKCGLDARLTIAGWVENVSIARNLAIDMGVENFVSFTGTYTQEEAPEIYRDADAYVITKYLDPCPNTVIEAMSSGLPILYSSSGGVPELVGDAAGVGLSVPQSWSKVYVPSSKDIGEGMLAIACNAHEMGSAARDRAIKHFDLNAWIKRHDAVFTELLN